MGSSEEDYAGWAVHEPKGGKGWSDSIYAQGVFISGRHLTDTQRAFNPAGDKDRAIYAHIGHFTFAICTQRLAISRHVASHSDLNSQPETNVTCNPEHGQPRMPMSALQRSLPMASHLRQHLSSPWSPLDKACKICLPPYIHSTCTQVRPPGQRLRADGARLDIILSTSHSPRPWVPHMMHALPRWRGGIKHVKSCKGGDGETSDGA